MSDSLEQTEVSKILVIDDDPTTRFMLVQTLNKSGYMVEEADCGEKGIEKVSAFVPELILLDVMMPGMDGFETCGEIRKITSYNEMPVMMLTGLDDETSVDKAFTVGANDFITKPINWSLLVKRVKYLIRDRIIHMQLVENEARLRQSQRIAKIFYWELKPSNSMVTMSDTFKEQVGLPSEKEIHYSHFINLVHDDERELIEEKISKILKKVGVITSIIISHAKVEKNVFLNNMQKQYRALMEMLLVLLVPCRMLLNNAMLNL